MAQKRAPKSSKSSGPQIPLRHPDKSGPSQETLLEYAQKKGLFNEATQKVKANQAAAAALLQEKQDQEGDAGEAELGRFGESVLWGTSLMMVHFTLDVLTTHQYAEELVWGSLVGRSLRAFVVLVLLFYYLHPHADKPLYAPKLPKWLNQFVFLAGSVGAGCHLIHITNEYSYYHVLKRAPPLGVVWIWSVIELDLIYAAASALMCVAYLKWNGYSVM